MNLLKIHRIKKAVTQLEMARALGITEQKVCKIETGRLKPDSALAEQIAQYLGLPIAAIEIAQKLQKIGKGGENDE